MTTAAIDRVAYRQSRARRSTLIALGVDRGVRCGAAVRGDVVAGLAAGTRLVLQPAGRLGEPACAVGGVVAQRPGARGLPGADPDLRARAGRGADAARSGVVSVAGVGNRVRRPVPRPAPADLPVPRRVRSARAAVVGRSDEPGAARRPCAGADLLRLRGRGLPGGHRIGPSLAAGGRQIPWPQLPAHDATGGAAPGDTPGDARAAQRLRRAAEGLRADLGARRRRRGAGRADPGRHHLQLHPVRRGRPVVRRAGGAVGAARRLGVEACGDPTGRDCDRARATRRTPVLSVRRPGQGLSRSVRCSTVSTSTSASTRWWC